MIGAVVQHYSEIHHGKAGQKAGLSGLDNSFFHSRNIVSRNRAPEDFVYKLEIGTARQRLHANPAVAELPVTAGLLLMPTLDVGFAPDGLTIRNFGRLECDIDAVTLFQAADDHLDVLLSAAREQKLLRLWVAVEP